VLDGDDEETLRDRILVKEHELLPAVLQWIADDRVEVVPPREGVAGARPTVRIHAHGSTPPARNTDRPAR